MFHLRKNKHAKLLAQKAGISYKEAYEEMKAIHDMTGLSFAQYEKHDLHNLKMNLRIRAANRLMHEKEARERAVQAIAEDTGWTPEQVYASRRDLNERLDGYRLSMSLYQKYELYKLDEAKQVEIVSAIRQRRKTKDAFQKAFAGPFYESEDGVQKLKDQYEEIRALTKELLTPTIVDKICESAALKYPEVLSDGAVRQELALDVEAARNSMGIKLSEYLPYDFLHKTFEEKVLYLPYREQREVLEEVNDKRFTSILVNKYRSYRHFRKLYGRDIAQVNNEEDYKTFLDYCEKHPVFVKKPAAYFQGKGIEKIDSSEYGSKKKLFEQLLEENGSFVMEELVHNHAALDAVNPDSLNTLRVLTALTGRGGAFIDEDGRAFRDGALRNCGDGVYALLPIFRTGREGSFIDNASAGGVVCGVDLRTGKVNSKGFDKEGALFDCHPDTGVRFEDLSMPDWEDAIQLVKQAALKLPQIPVIGWDITYTDKEKWVLIEGNSSTGIMGQGPLGYGILPEYRALIASVR